MLLHFSAQIKQGQRKTPWREAGSEKHSSAQATDSAGEKENHVSSEQHNDTPDDEEVISTFLCICGKHRVCYSYLIGTNF